MITISSLSKNFGQIKALNNINLSVDEPGLTCFLGENGAGKTTLFKIITGILKPSSGSLKINGIDIQSQPKEALSLIGALVEQPEFYPYLTGKELLEFTGKIRGLKGRDLENDVERVTKMMNLGEYLLRKSGTYSRGMKQRLGVAAAMVGDPVVLVLDEPTFGMDPRGIIEMRKILLSMKNEGEKYILMSTHLLEEARELADRIVIISHGEVKSDLKAPFNKGLLKVIGDIKVPTALNDRIIERRDGYIIIDAGEDDATLLISKLIKEGSRIRYVLPYDKLEEHFLSE
ncbi:MAG: ABC transporter ATP-binding protein [Thermoplasmatales archaeon]